MATKTKPTHAAAPTRVAVILRKARHPGLLRVGDMLPDTPYERDAAEAVRLVDTFGFEFVNPADEAAARSAVAVAAKQE